VIKLDAIHDSLLLDEGLQVFFNALGTLDLLQQTFLASFESFEFLQALFLFHELATHFEFSVLLETLQSRVPKALDVFFASDLDQSDSVSL
jgi:hypothetical protein